MWGEGNEFIGGGGSSGGGGASGSWDATDKTKLETPQHDGTEVNHALSNAPEYNSKPTSDAGQNAGTSSGEGNDFVNGRGSSGGGGASGSWDAADKPKLESPQHDGSEVSRALSGAPQYGSKPPSDDGQKADKPSGEGVPDSVRPYTHPRDNFTEGDGSISKHGIDKPDNRMDGSKEPTADKEEGGKPSDNLSSKDNTDRRQNPKEQHEVRNSLEGRTEFKDPNKAEETKMDTDGFGEIRGRGEPETTSVRGEAGQSTSDLQTKEQPNETKRGELRDIGNGREQQVENGKADDLIDDGKVHDKTDNRMNGSSESHADNKGDGKLHSDPAGSPGDRSISRQGADQSVPLQRAAEHSEQLMNEATTKTGNGAEKIEEGATEIGKGEIAKGAKDIVQGIGESTQGFGEMFSKAGQVVKETGQAASDSVPQLGEGLKKDLGTNGEVAKAFGGIAGEGLEAVAETSAEVGEAAAEIAGQSLKTIGDMISGVGTLVKGAAEGNFGEGVGELAGKNIENVAKIGGEVLEGGLEVGREVLEGGLEVGREVFKGVGEIITDAIK